MSAVTPGLAVPILIVDDNAAKRLAVKAVLMPLGFPIVEAQSGIEALRCVMEQDFAVILLDICMPDMDGFETAGLIRQRVQSEMTPIIFFTAFGSDDISNADRYAEGAVDFMFAPVPPNELRAKVSVFANLFIKAEELAVRARAVQTEADQLSLLTDAAPIGIFRTDELNRYVYTNPRWSEITGVSADDALGCKWGTIVGSELHDAGQEARQSALERTELSHRFEIRNPLLPTRTVLVTAAPIPDSDGGIAGWVGTVADVTAEAGAEAAMADARDQATEASRLKSDFLVNMSHEIRTPMNGVIGMTDLLLETDLDGRQREYAQTVRNSGEALLTIINDILDFSKIEAGKLEVEDIDFSVETIVGDVVDLLARPAQTKGLELVVVIETSVPGVVSGDPGRVRQVLTNLIGNAVKFTQAGEIVVRVSAAVADGEAVVRFEVSDTGDGIARDKQETIFQPFVQADTSTSRKYGGTGLGLAISGQLVALMGGDCGVVSALGAGSQFWFTICVHADSAQPVDELLLPDAGLTGVKALIVDDNETLRTELADQLTRWGMAVSTAEGGTSALTALRAATIEGAPFAVALVDRSIPDMDGLRLDEAIILDPSISARVVTMTGLGERQGAGSSLTKPVHRQGLRTCLRASLGLQVADDGASMSVTERWTATPEPVAGRLLLAEDNTINQMVAVAMLSSAGYQVDIAASGAEAVQAVAAHRYDAILMDCHMPEMNGYEATAAIRAHEGSGRRTPIIAMTAGARNEDRERCLAEGMDSYLAKPVSKDALLALVARSLTAAPEDLPVLDREVLEQLRVVGTASDGDFVSTLIDRFTADTGPLLVRLREACDAGDAHAVARMAHSLKGSCGDLGGRRLAASCDRLQSRVNGIGKSGCARELEDVELEHRALCEALSQQSLTHDRGSSRPALDPEVIDRLERLGGTAGEDFVAQLAGVFLAEADAHVGALHKALADEDDDALVGSAHTLSGASANLGATALAQLCSGLTSAASAGGRANTLELINAVEVELGIVRNQLASRCTT